MLPRAHPQHNLMTRPTKPNPRIQTARAGPDIARCLPAFLDLVQAVRILGVHVKLLLAVVRARQGAARDVRAQDDELRVVGHVVGFDGIGFQEPDEAGAEHGVRGCEEGLFEGVGRGEGAHDVGVEFGGDGGWGRRERCHGVVRVPGHGGVVEEGGGGGVPGVG